LKKKKNVLEKSRTYLDLAANHTIKWVRYSTYWRVWGIEWRKNIIKEKMKHCYDMVKVLFVSGTTAPGDPGAPH
jgi:hypothetical protein